MNAWIPRHNVPFKSFDQVFVITHSSIKSWNIISNTFLGCFLSLKVKVTDVHKNIFLCTYSLLVTYNNIVCFASPQAARYKALTQPSQHHEGQQIFSYPALQEASPNTCGCFHHNCTMLSSWMLLKMIKAHQTSQNVTAGGLVSCFFCFIY